MAERPHATTVVMLRELIAGHDSVSVDPQVLAELFPGEERIIVGQLVTVSGRTWRIGSDGAGTWWLDARPWSPATAGLFPHRGPG